MSPVRAVRREGDVGAAVEELEGGVHLWAARHGEVVGAENLAGQTGGGDDDSRDLAES